MADGAGTQGNSSSGVYDPRTDPGWQARLEEARRKREIALRDKAKPARSARRRKPWEEEGVNLPDDDPDFSPASTGFEFTDRVERMRERARGVSEEIRPAPGSEPVRTREEPEAPADVLSRRPASRRPVSERLILRTDRARDDAPGKVNDVFADPSFGGASRTEPEEETGGYASLLSPDPPPRARFVVEDEAEETPAAASEAVPAPKRASRLPGRAAAALLFVSAVAVGPVWQMTRPVERGPLVYTLSSFNFTPALGLTGPMFATPTETRAGEWRPPSFEPPAGPLRVARPSVPRRATRVDALRAPPASDDAARILFGVPVAGAPRASVGRAALPAPAVEPRLGADAQAAGIGRGLEPVTEPPERPKF